MQCLQEVSCNNKNTLSLCPLVHRIKTAKQKQNSPKQFTERYKYTVQIYFIQKGYKKQQNIVNNALQVQVGVGYSKGALWVDNSKASDKSQYIMVGYSHTILKLTLQSLYNLDYT